MPCMEERLTGVRFIPIRCIIELTAYSQSRKQFFNSVTSIIYPVAVHDMCDHKDHLATRFRVHPGQMFQIPVCCTDRRMNQFLVLYIILI